MTTSIKKTYRFEYAHRIYDQKKTAYNIECACRNLHGHSGVVSIFLGGSLNNVGMIIDFNDLKPIKDFFKTIDHALFLSSEDPILHQMFPTLPVVTKKEKEFSIYPEKIIVFSPLESNSLTSEILGRIFFRHISSKIIPEIIETIKSDNSIELYRLEFSETENNMIIIEG